MDGTNLRATTMNRGFQREPFWLSLSAVTLLYALLIVALLVSLAAYATPTDIWTAMHNREIRFAMMLSFFTCTLTATLSLLIAVPTGYLLSRGKIRGASLIESILDIPIVLPPMVIGLCLLVFFQTTIGRAIESVMQFTYTVAGVVLAQLVISAAFAIRTMRSTFDHISPRAEEVAMTLGCTRWQAFYMIALPAAGRGMIAAETIAWARSLGEFGPILVFAGATRMKTEVLPTTIWLELNVGNLEAAVAVSLLLVLSALLVLTTVRLLRLEANE